MKRTVIYGLGKRYGRYARVLERKLNVVAHCDKNEELVKKFSDGITTAELAENMDSYDEVYVTTSLTLVYSYLVDELHIPEGKITAIGHRMSMGGGHSTVQFYSDDGEDIVLSLLLERMRISVSTVKYIEIGTNDPISGNNSYFLYEAGARGVLVDPLPVAVRLAKIYRPGDKMIQAAITDTPKEKTTTFYESSAISSSSLHEEFYKEFDPREGRHVVNAYTVPLMGINELIAEAGFMPDVLLVDAEGEDETIVRGIDFRLYRPKIIMVEIDHCDEAGLVSFMKEKGYSLFTTINLTNAVFLDKKGA